MLGMQNDVSKGILQGKTNYMPQRRRITIMAVSFYFLNHQLKVSLLQLQSNKVIFSTFSPQISV